MRFLGKRETSTRVDLHPATLMRKVKAGAFPKPVDLGGGRIAFVETEIEEWIAGRIAARDAANKDEKRHSSQSVDQVAA